ncbi:ABC transporter permease [Halomicroarcula sp. S1AR25-4]|uniref:Transport permease protein n=1 Tax=Haloarcula pellucida TaxID=1427151 RepID=A0A830GQN5_9EURY|nr:MULTISPECIES: ABC transporter permease [Halomicroarcula]MBX0350180.1 ABC transporter permease [Halomicroarcula pellucida]MDS0277718.1 ABC transporter permease [Halomicroarcula sp. S1AR25-4]GGO00772.1 transport permease protein [Halomicroarcula pellucida]
MSHDTDVGTNGAGPATDDARDGAPTGLRARLVGLWTLLHREILRYVRRPRNTFLPPMITNVLYFTVFGVVLGERISGNDPNAFGGAGYILFILPGLVVLGMISNAFENASFSIFHGRWNEYIHEVLTSPLSHTEMVLAYVAASSLRGIVVGAIIWGVGLVFTPVTVANPFYLAAFTLVIPTLFAAFGVIGGLWARDFDYLTVMNQFIIRPLVFFGAVFYPLSALSGIWRQVTLLNPMVYMVNGVRYGVIPEAVAVPPNRSLFVLTGLTVAVIFVDIELVKRGYGLVD